MSTTFQSLAWKEWHEQKWRLAALTATLSGIAICLLVRSTAEWLATVRVTLAICIVPLAIFIGLNSASGERSGGTLPFLQALPVPMWRVALHKLLFGAVSVVAPVLLTLVIVYGGYQLLAMIGFDVGDLSQFKHQNDDAFSFRVKNWFLDTGLVLSVLAVSFYIWAAAGGVNRKDEISAGAVALVAMLLWFIAVIYVNYWVDRWGRLPSGKVADSAISFEVMTVSTLPGGLLSTAEKSSRLQNSLFIVGIGIAAAVHLALATWFILRFGRVTNVEVRSPQGAARSADRNAWLAAPRNSAFSAIAWKQFRESGPILLAGLAGIIGIVAAVFVSVWIDRGDIPYIGDIYTAITIAMGFVMSLVIGIGVAFYDVRPQLNTFWRSRPINPDAWFWCKYGTGMVVLLATIYLPILLIAGLGDVSGQRVLRDMPLIPLAQVAVFAAALSTTCIFRHAIYAAILSIPMLYIGILLVWAGLAFARLVGWVEFAPTRHWDLNETQMAAGLVLSIFISSIAAWLSVRYDWGVKSRY